MKILDIYEDVMGEDYPTTWNIEQFAALRSFAERQRYCEQHLQRISSGSGRIAYKVDNEKVLKLAKNRKGIAQNEVEIQYGNERYFSNIVAQIYEYHNDALWVEMELARKVSPSVFKKIVGVDILTFSLYLRNQTAENRGRKAYFSIDPEVKEFLGNSEFANDVMDFLMSSDSDSGDLGRLSSWGLVNRGGSDSLVIVDYGLTQGVYDTHYNKRRIKY